MRRVTSTSSLFGVASLLVANAASAKTIYVSGEGNDKTNDGSTAGAPLRSLQVAADRTSAGDVVEVADGTYTAFTIRNSGQDKSWIRYVASAGAKPKIESTGWNGILIESASYIEIRGFEVEGAMASRTLEQCTADADAAMPDAMCNGNGISVDGRKASSKPHHILIAGNTVHDCPGGGISAITADYITVEDNFIYDTSWHTRYASSGISFLTAWNTDTSTAVKMIVRRNRVFGNKTLVKWTQIGKLSDGNGIIIDTSKSETPEVLSAHYTGRTLVENNLSVGNGGSGIHAYASEHVDIIHNTSYQNGQVVGYPEIFSNNSGDVRILNNIMIARADGDVNSKDARSTATYDYNVYFAGKVASKGEHDIVGDPKVVRASLDRAVADFRLTAGSPAVNSATATLTTSVDLAGAARPVGPAPDRGAYELGAAPPAGGAADGGMPGVEPGAAPPAGGAVDGGAPGVEPGHVAASDASIVDGGSAHGGTPTHPADSGAETDNSQAAADGAASGGCSVNGARSGDEPNVPVILAIGFAMAVCARRLRRSH